MRFLYWGLPIGALLLAKAGFAPSVIMLQGSHPGVWRLRRQLAKNGSLVLRDSAIEDRFIQETLTSISPDLLVTYFYPKRIPAFYLELVGGQAFGIHPSLLPRWRGPDPIFWTLNTGDVQTGVTLYRLSETYDSGEIIEQSKMVVPPQSNAYRLSLLLEKIGIDLLVKCLTKFSQGQDFRLVTQNESQVTQAPEPDERLLGIHWSRSALDIVRLIQAASPYPGAVTTINGHCIEVLGACVDPAPPRLTLKPGEAAAMDKGISVKAQDDFVLITRVRLLSGKTLQTTALHTLLQ